jgi:hypothetical protein
MTIAVLDAGVAIGWITGRRRSLVGIERLMDAGRLGRITLVLSVVNLAEVLRHTKEMVQATGADPWQMLQGYGVHLHRPDEVVARAVALLPCSLADGFAAATAQVLGGRLHTTTRGGKR